MGRISNRRYQRSRPVSPERARFYTSNFKGEMQAVPCRRCGASVWLVQSATSGKWFTVEERTGETPLGTEEFFRLHRPFCNH